MGRPLYGIRWSKAHRQARLEPGIRHLQPPPRCPACDRGSLRLPAEARPLGEYFATWLEHRPRAARTNATYEHRVGRVLDVEIEGRPLAQWPLAELRRPQALALVEHLLSVQGRTASGAAAILRALSAMAEDAVTDELVERNPFKGVRVLANEPRVRKRQRPGARVQLRDDASVCEGGRRPRSDGARLHRCRASPRRGPTTATRGLRRPHTPRLPHCPRRRRRGGDEGRPRRARPWRESGFYRSVWGPAREASGIDIRPHECRHSYISHHLRRAGIDDADLARIAGHRLSTMLARYSHSIGGSFEDVRRAIG